MLGRDAVRISSVQPQRSLRLLRLACAVHDRRLTWRPTVRLSRSIPTTQHNRERRRER